MYQGPYGSGQRTVRVVPHDDDPRFNFCCGTHVRILAVILAVWFGVTLALNWFGSIIVAISSRDSALIVGHFLLFNFWWTFCVVCFIWAIAKEVPILVWPIRINYWIQTAVTILITVLITAVVILSLVGVAVAGAKSRKNSTITADGSISITVDDDDDPPRAFAFLLAGILPIPLIGFFIILAVINLVIYRLVRRYQYFLREKKAYERNQQVCYVVGDK